MQLGPDGKIYISGYGGNIPAITAPNLAGTACAFTIGYAPTGMNPSSDFPSFISSFEYHNGVPPCLANMPPSSGFFASTDSICPGTCIDFTNTSTNATHYSWFFPGSNNLNDTSYNPQNVCYIDTGYHDVILITTNSSGSDTLVRHIYVFPPAQSSPIYQSGDTLFATPGFASYKWYKDTTLIPHAYVYFYVPPTDGTYSVIMTDDNGCTSIATVLNVQVGITETNNSSNELLIYYRDGKICLEQFYNNFDDVEATITDVFGRTVLNAKFNLHSGKNINYIDKILPPGIYIANISNTHFSRSIRFMIK
jgi:PKD repeat protein